ncbi:MAG TPA: NAD(P)H-dependent oxidoreductase subunit E, partial [Candidatus Aminicenantes bacterium]|nr:NAD(P)H-dependent oxidoreductase subunit E [Candidatus Aminicenantes bacterium]
MPKLNNRADLEGLQKKLQTASTSKEKCRIHVCAGLGCVTKGALKVHEALAAALEKRGLLGSIDLYLKGEHEGVTAVKTGCLGLCEAGPVVHVSRGDVLYVNVTPENAEAIVEKTALKGELVEEILPRDGQKVCRTIREVPFYAKQQKIVLRNCGVIDPTDIRDYIAHQGYAALIGCIFDSNPEKTVELMLDSGLRGRGGAGFSTGRKWKFAAAEKNEQKYVIVNADEGDPGAFMDRSVLEGDPHSVIEGAAIAAFAIGAN